MNDYEWKLSIKGGPGSGHHGHVGRPGKVGGSISGTATQILDKYPKWLTEGASIELVLERGPMFQSGGQEFEAAAEWDTETGTILIYNSDEYKTSPEIVDRLIAHELGHKLHEMVTDRAIEQLDGARRDGFHLVSGYDQYGPILTPDAKYRAPIFEAHQDFERNWKRSGGTTNYSRSFSHSGEAFADLVELYFVNRRGFDLTITPLKDPIERIMTQYDKG